MLTLAYSSLFSLIKVSIKERYLGKEVTSTQIGIKAWLAPQISEHCP